MIIIDVFMFLLMGIVLFVIHFGPILIVALIIFLLIQIASK